MAITLFKCAGGTVVLPSRGAALVSREDGGNLIVNPPHEVWERSELTPQELAAWGALAAAAGRAMIDTLPQLAGGCVNYWEAGNWALSDTAAPRGPKRAPEHRRVHLHLLGRSPRAKHPAWRWGEAPKFPDYADRLEWAREFERLTAEECQIIIVIAMNRLITRGEIEGFSESARCGLCGYPCVGNSCEECESG
jgi:diadenosine tetraphosphate (Ap4A) HIT family hydrolase